MTEDTKSCCDTEKSCCGGENKGLTCPITGCPVKHILLATLGVFLVTYGFDFLYHGVLLKGDYMATASLWRTEADMKANWPVCLLYHFVLSFGIAGLYCFVGKKSSCGGACPATGVKFGLLLGMILGISAFSAYIWLPMPLGLAVKWLVGNVILGVLLGFILSRISGKLGGCCK